MTMSLISQRLITRNLSRLGERELFICQGMVSVCKLKPPSLVIIAASALAPSFAHLVACPYAEQVGTILLLSVRTRLFIMEAFFLVSGTLQEADQ